MRKKQNIFCLFLLGVILSMPANAQVFSGAAPTKTNAESAQRQIAQPSKPVVKPLEVQTETVLPAKNKTLREVARSTNDDTFSPVKKNFNADQKQDEVKNDSSKVFHFKIVNGKITFDDDDHRSVLVYYDNYQIHRGFDKMVKCTIRVYVLNDLKEKITSIGFKLKWPEIMTSVEMSQLKPGVTTYTDLMLLGEGCLHMDKTPTIEVNRCRVRGMSQEACADAIKWFPKQH